MEGRFTLIDPAYYTKPLESDVKTWTLEPDNALATNDFGWFGVYPALVDLLCAPINADGSASNPYGGD